VRLGLRRKPNGLSVLGAWIIMGPARRERRLHSWPCVCDDGANVSDRAGRAWRLAHVGKGAEMRPNEETGVVTVAAVREDGGRTEVLFNERQQVFSLRATRASAALEGKLREALSASVPVRAVLNPRQGLVKAIDTPEEEELRAFQERFVSLEDPQKTMRIEVERIDPTTFNIVEHYLNIPVFRLCRNIVPSYAKAKEIFDFCAAQSCNLPGPYAIPQCIPFQYVIDGCYARAHAMRRIIEDQYGYCCEKVFSFANQNMDSLAVNASKWGGCCVTWWYHVAPLVRVRVTIRLGTFQLQFVIAFVIDPGMFDRPVLLSSWLAAQQNLACSPNAHVSMYSIQPGSAYTPANYQGTAFNTDPSYANTDATLVAYATLTTCP
jgi:Glutaminase